MNKSYQQDSSGPIEISLSEGIALLRLNRPSQRNAMSAGLVTAMIEALGQLNHDRAVGAIILKGHGKGFCAGSDLAGLAAMSPAGKSRFEADSGRLARMIGQCDKPVIAAVHGFAIGGGLTLATACDIVLTTADAKWSLPEVPIGLFPAWGMASVVDRIGPVAARRLAWGIDMLDGAAAARYGLADEVTDDVEGAATRLAVRLAALPREQAAAVKRYFAQDAANEAADIRANRLFMDMTLTPEAQLSFDRFGQNQT